MTSTPVKTQVNTMKLFARNVIRYSGFISLFACISAPLLAADQPATMIVIDGSNSMWTQVQGQHKIVIARESLDTLVKGAGNTPLGLTTYGGKCNSVKVVGGIGMDNTELLKRANKLMPKGRSPIANALKAAANEVKNSGNILLISDGEESCEADPCETAATLKQHYPNLVINVLGFNAKDEAQLQCIANNTGGRFVLAQNPASIGALFTDLQPIIEEKAIAGSSSNASDLIALSSGLLQNPGTLRLSLGEVGQAENLRSSYFIYTPDNQLVAQMTQGEVLQTDISAGTYRVSALWKGFRQSQTVTVKPKETTEYRFNLDKIGTLKLSATDASGQPVRANYALYDTNDKAITNHVLLDQVNERLPAGKYRVKATYNQNSLEQDVEVSPQGVSEQIFEFKAPNS